VLVVQPERDAEAAQKIDLFAGRARALVRRATCPVLTTT
jgi:hypothetical protein